MKATNRLNNIISDNPELLKIMVHDSKKVKNIYQPGHYWIIKTKSAISQIKKYGLNNFRGMTNGIGTSYADNFYADIRVNYGYGIKYLIVKIFSNIYPFNKFFNSQIQLTINYLKEVSIYKNFLFKNNKRVTFLLSKYNLSFDTTRGGCLSFGKFNGLNISYHYLQLLDSLDRLNQMINIRKCKTFLEIGGGFGVNTHLSIELFKIKKIIYVDISPNLYVATQYLRSFYGNSVIDYKKCKDMKEIKFSSTNKLEIFCIAPHQIKKIRSEIDFFHNANSFIEMPENVVKNYAKEIEEIMSDTGVISLISYGEFDLSNTIHPEKLPRFFKKSAIKKIYPSLSPLCFYYYFIIR